MKRIICSLFILFTVVVYCYPQGYSYNLGDNWRLYEESGYLSKPLIVDLPGNWNEIVLHNKDCAAIIKLQKDFIWDGAYTGELVLYLGRIAILDETYINGHCIGMTGSIPSDNVLNYDFLWIKERVYIFHSSILKKGKNTIEIKVFSHYINGIEKQPVIYTLKDWEKKNRWNIIIPNFNNINSVIIAILLLILFIPLSKSFSDTIMNWYIFLFVLFVFLLNVLLFPIIHFNNNLWRFKLFYICYMLTDFILVVIIRHFVKMKDKKVYLLFLFVLIVAIVYISYLPTTFHLVHYGTWLFVAILILFISYALYLFIQACIKDPQRYWYISIFVIIVFLSAAKTYYIILTYSLYSLPMSMTLRLPLLIAVALSIYLFDLRNVKFERDSLLAALVRKTKQVQRLERLVKINQKPKPQEVILKIKEYLDANFNESYDRAMLAKKFSINEDYMCQLFKKVTTMNIAQYINMKRIEMAKQLLSETESKVIDIAFHVGFDNLTYFYRTFKQFTGVTPNEYRARVKTIAIKADVDDEAL